MGRGPSLLLPCYPLRHADDTLRHSASGTGMSIEARRSRLKSGEGDRILPRERPVVHHTCQPPHPKPAGKATPRRGRWVAIVATSTLPPSLPTRPGMCVAHRWPPAKARAPPPPPSLHYPSRSAWDGVDLDGPTATSTTTSRRRRRHHRLSPATSCLPAGLPPVQPPTPLLPCRHRGSVRISHGTARSGHDRAGSVSSTTAAEGPSSSTAAAEGPSSSMPPPATVAYAYLTLPTVRPRPSQRPSTLCRGWHDAR
uniref:Uncharacterized protein n=1 Tax=Oryza glumipatula TaxID=40148 RepID=A0A0D9YUG4_9ORYZ